MQSFGLNGGGATLDRLRGDRQPVSVGIATVGVEQVSQAGRQVEHAPRSTHPTIGAIRQGAGPTTWAADSE